MRLSYLALAAAAAFSLGACGRPAEEHADALESQAYAAHVAGNDAQADALEDQADAVEESAGQKD